MSDIKLQANYSRYNNDELSQKVFESFLNNDPVSSFIYSFNNIPQNIEYITSSFENFIKFINTYPGKSEDIAKFIFDECSDFLSKMESKNESYYNKLSISEEYIEDYKNYFNLPYTKDVPVLILLIPHIKLEVSTFLSKHFHKNYHYLFEEFQNNITKEVVDSPNYDSKLSLYLNKSLESLGKEDYEKALFFLNLNMETYSGTPGYTNINEETFNNIPFIKQLKENYLKRTDNELYLSSTVYNLLEYLSMKRIDFFSLYINHSSQSPSNSLKELINFKELCFGDLKDDEYLPYFKMTFNKIKEDETSFYSNDEESFKKNMATQRVNLVFDAFLISSTLPVKVNSLFGNERLSTILKSDEFIEKLSSTYDNKIGSNLIHKDYEFLFHTLFDYQNNLSFSLSFLNSAYEKHVNKINENNQLCQKNNDYSNYISIPELNLNFIIDEFNLTLNSIIQLGLDEPLNTLLSKTYTSNLEMFTSSIKDKSVCELNYELLINTHDAFLDLIQVNGNYSKFSDNQIKQVDRLIKQYFFRPLNEVESKFSAVTKMKELPLTSFDNISIGSLHYFTGNNLSFRERNPLAILDQYIELLTYKSKEDNNPLAISLLKEHKPYLTNLFEAMCHSDIYTNCIYNPENMEKVLPSLTNLKNLILKSDIWTNTEQFQILKNIDNSTISLVYYNDPTTYSKIFKYATEPYTQQYKNKLNIFEEIFSDIEQKVMTSEKEQNQASNSYKKIKKF